MTGFLAKGGGRVSARRPTHFLLLRQEKVSKEKATQLSATPALRYGATCVGEFAGCAVELATRCALHSDNHGESVHEACVSCGTHATPQTPRHRRIQMGRCTTGLCFARPGGDEALCARPWEPSAATARDHPVEAGPRSAGFGGSGIALFERSEFSETPLNPSTAGCPERSAGTQTAGRLFLLTSFGEAKEVSAPPGAYPGRHTSKSKCYKLRSKVPA